MPEVFWVSEKWHKILQVIAVIKSPCWVGHPKTLQTFCISVLQLGILTCRWQKQVSYVFQGLLGFSLPDEVWIQSLRVPKIQPASSICPFVLSILNFVTLSIRMNTCKCVLIIYLRINNCCGDSSRNNDDWKNIN